MVVLNRIFICLIIILIVSCNRNNNVGEIKFDSKLNASTFNKHIKCFNNGIYKGIFSCKSYSDYSKDNNDNAVCFSDIYKDTINIFCEILTGTILFSIYNNQYKVKILYNTDIMGTYKNGYNDGTYYEPTIKNVVLKIKNKSLTLNDTLYGYLNIKTRPFYELTHSEHRNIFSKWDKNAYSYEGYFKTILTKRISDSLLRDSFYNNAIINVNIRN